MTIQITPQDDRTRLVLAHEEAGADGGHEEGWTASFARLDRELG